MSSAAPAARHHEAFLNALDGPFRVLGGMDVECPVCGKVSRPDWQLYTTHDLAGTFADTLPAKHEKDKYNQVWIEWLRCAHEDCEQLIVRISESRPTAFADGGAPLITTDTWIARPRFGESKRQIASEVPEPFRSDYLEAAAILDITPRMSAVLSRSILADLLEKYLALTAYGLNERINEFRAKSDEPKRLRDGAHHFREIGDFGSHTQKNDQDQIIAVDREDAEWMLSYLDRFLDYYVVAPERDDAVLGKWDKNIADAGRRPIPPLPEEES